MPRTLLCLLVAALLPACASLPAADTRPWQRWSIEQGGLVDSADPSRAVPRAEAAAARLAAACACPDVVVRVLDSRRTEAFAWRDGSVFVTRGLVEILDADELAAVIAHEIGHLSGRGDDLPAGAAEELADRLGGELLLASGIAPESMLGMLAKLGASAANRRIAARIAVLRARLDESGARAGQLLAALD